MDRVQTANLDEDLMRTVFDTSLIGISVLETIRDENGLIEDFCIKLVNKELERGTNRNDLVGKRYCAEYPGIKKSGLFELMCRVVEAGESQGVEYYYPFDGYNKWFSCMLSKFDDGVIATYLDISERKQAEEEKFKNLTLLQQTEVLTNTGSWEYDLSSQSLKWSDGMYKLFGIADTNIITPEIYLEYCKKESNPAARRIVDYIKTGQGDFEGTIKLLIAGQSKIFKTKATVIHDINGQPKSVWGVDLDVTDLKKAEQRSKDDAVFIKGIADAAPDMLYVIDIRTMQMIYANKNIVELFNKSPEEIKQLGREFFNIHVHPHDIAKFNENIEAVKLSADGEVCSLTYRLFDFNKKIHWIQTKRTVYKRTKDGVPSLIIGISQDITQQVILEKNNRQLVKERAEREKRLQHEIVISNFNAQEEERKRISESLHNGLGQLLYGIKLSLEQIKLNKADSYEDNSLYLQQASIMLANAIHDTRTISHDITPTILEQFGLKAAVEDICTKLATNSFTIFNCEFIGLPIKMNKYYEIATYRIIQELAFNITKHAKATKAAIKVENTKKHITVLIHDNGVGFSTNTTPINGTGLESLKSKIKLLNGTMQISSLPGRGTSIKVQIPN